MALEDKQTLLFIYSGSETNEKMSVSQRQRSFLSFKVNWMSPSMNMMGKGSDPEEKIDALRVDGSDKVNDLCKNQISLSEKENNGLVGAGRTDLSSEFKEHMTEN